MLPAPMQVAQRDCLHVQPVEAAGLRKQARRKRGAAGLG
jgi:hypothetical protein